MVNVTIDNRKESFLEGTTLLEAARTLGIYIPTLCYHEALTPYGACRLCMVEITVGGRKRLVASCVYPVEEGLQASTTSEAVIQARKDVMELLLAQCPNVEILEEMAAKLGLKKPRFVLDEKDQSDCIRCGRCARACLEIVGVGAIDFTQRGIASEIQPPFLRASDVCISCGTCEYFCPTGAIKMHEVDSIEMVHRCQEDRAIGSCRICGTNDLSSRYVEVP